MKKNLLPWLAGMALLAACQSSPQGTGVSGTLTGLTNDTLLVKRYSMLDTSDVQCDTLLATDGRFTFLADNDTVPSELYIYADTENGETCMSLVLLPGEHPTLSGPADDYQIKGSNFNIQWHESNVAMRPYLNELDSIGNELSILQAEGAPQEEIFKLYAEAFRPLKAKIDTMKADYVRQHPDQDMSLYYLYQSNREDVAELLPTLTDEVKNGPLRAVYQFLEKKISEEKARKEAAGKIKEGAPAPDFTLKDINGKPLALSSLRGKYVVLDFWGSWCGWCIKGIPDMKKYYEKYKDRMEILGIDCRDTEEKWKAAVEHHGLLWLHVRNEGNPDVSVLYAVPGYPTKIVVDPEGRIAKIVVGESPEFYDYLDSLFK